MTTLDDIVSEYQNAVNEQDWTRGFSVLVEDLEGHKYGNKLNLKNEFLEKIGIDHQHDNPHVGSLQSHAQNLLYLQSLGVTNIGKVVTKHPQIFSYSIEDNLQPHVDYLEKLGVTDIAKVITRLPHILYYSIEDTLKPTVDYLEKLGVTDIGKVVTKLPSILAYSIEDNLQPHIEYLKELGVTDIGKIVTRNPSILHLSIEDNLKPTVEYLTNQCYATISDIEKMPALVSYSLDKRIKPRHAFLQTKGVEVGYDIAVGTMLTPNDKKFAKSDYDEWMKFKEDYIEKNKI